MNLSSVVSRGSACRAALVASLATVLLVGCGASPTDQKETLYVFGTLLDMNAYTEDSEGFRNGVQAVDQMFQQMHQDWHAWKGEGELMRLNRAFATGESMEVSDAMLSLLKAGARYSEMSGGLFNPAIGKLIAQWGFHNDELPVGELPSRESLETLVAEQPRMSDIEFEDHKVNSRNPAVQLDLGAYAKGHALNLAVDKLKTFGLSDVIVNAGGDLCVAGRHGDRPWKVGIRHPQGQGVIGALNVADGECVLTSGNYERYREHEGIRYAHIIDPRTGVPVRHVASATVISSDGALADAAATALSVAGSERWLEVTRAMGLKEVMVVDEEGRVYLTPAMKARVEFQIKPVELIVETP